jgi:hypothetical protein
MRRRMDAFVLQKGESHERDRFRRQETQNHLSRRPSESKQIKKKDIETN